MAMEKRYFRFRVMHVDQENGLRVACPHCDSVIALFDERGTLAEYCRECGNYIWDISEISAAESHVWNDTVH